MTTLDVSKVGEVLTINGEAFDFTEMSDGDTLLALAISSAWFVGQVDRVGTEWSLPSSFLYHRTTARSRPFRSRWWMFLTDL